jgi:phospholipid transport system transporter-binding protein
MTKLTQTGMSSWLLEGELTFATVAGILNGGPQVKSAEAAVLDLSGVTRGDSAGLALLVEWLRAARDRGGTLEFTGVPREFVQLARVADLDGLIHDNQSR